MHNVISDDAQRVAILSDWLGPNVKRRVETLLMAPEGYVAALEYLQHQYGLPDKISRCRIKDLIGLPTCKTGDLPALQSFSDLLHGTVIVLQQAGNVHDLKSAANLEQIVQKLPVNIRSRWARLVLRLPRTPDLNDLDQLLQTVVDEERLMRPSEDVQMKQTARDAVYRSHEKPVKRQSGGPVERKRISGGASATLPPTILATQLASNDACLGCGKPHSVLDCSEFKRKSANERAQLVKATGSCFRCLRGKHRSRECEVEVSCSIRGCKARHHTLLHGAERVYPGRSGPQRQGLTTDEQPQAAMEREVNSVAPKTIAEVLLAVVPVRVQAGGRFLDTHALLDNGSQATLIREDAARLLGLKGPRKPVRFSTFQGSDPTIQSQIVDFVVSSRDGSRAYPVSGAYVVPHLNVGNRQIECQQTTFQYLRDLVVPARGVRDVQLLIGMDVQDAHLSADVRRPPPGVCGPNALLTPFGWCLVGRCPTPITGRAGPLAQINHVRVDHLLWLESAVEQFWRTQSMPVCMAPKTFMALEDKAALEQLERTIRHTGERYEVGLPVKENVVDLPDNREAARRSFAAFERRMRNDDELRRAVSATMEETLRNGHAVKVPPDYRTNGRVWYLPYHAVRNPNKPGKIRLVYNAAARYRGMALNDVLRKGPDLTTLLLAVLLRFRERRIGVSADIRKMFYQVLVPKADRSLFRFLWRRPGTQDPVETYEMTVHIFGAVSSPAVCNFALQRLMSDAPSDLKGVAGRIASDFYVDNFLSSFDCEKEALVTCQGLTRLLNTGGFELAQFLSSSRLVIESLPSSIWVDPELDIDLEGLPTERTLGYLWNCQTDAFVFHFKSTPEAETKRLILAAVSSVFDPLGLVAPVVLTAKIILQDVWRLKLEWDETVPTDVLTRWHRWTEEIPLLEEVTVRRSHLTQPQSNYRSVQLHAFADASKDGYGAVIYIPAETDVGVSVTFALAKARVAPIHQLSIPKLELQAALMAARLVSFYRRETTLLIDGVVLWSDASTVLRWLRSSHRRYITFVANRISEILDLTDVKDWRHVPGVLNPADELSRGLFPSQLDAEHRWFAGADFLYQSPECWPADIAPCDSPEVADEWLGSIGVGYDEGPIDVLIARSGNLHRLIRIVAWINRFAGNIRAAVKRSRLKEDTALNEPPVVVTPKVALRRSTRIAGKQFESDLQTIGRAIPAENIDAAANATIKTGRQQSADELKVARLTLIRIAQSASFPDEIARLSKGKLIQRESPLLTLSPFIDKQGHLRVGGRLQNSHLEYDARHQFILHPKHPLTRLLVRWAHICVAHHRAERTLAETRTRYWVLRGREAAKSIITRCFACAKDRASPLQPIMAALPEQRVRPFQRPFSNTGVDYFGPYNVSIGRRSEKRYGVLFTCLVTRAIHLELASSLDTDSFLLAFSRFASRRFTPTEVWSDNGTNLRAGERELKECVPLKCGPHLGAVGPS